MRELIPTYLETNHIDSLRHQLCEIIYNDYKGRTFTLDAKLAEKQEVLEKTQAFLLEHPEIKQYRDDSKYWYPYENVTDKQIHQFYNAFYPSKEDEITYFGKKGEPYGRSNDYLIDPVKLIFCCMCVDIKEMVCEEEKAKEIIGINQALFEMVINVVGNTIDYSGKNNLDYMTNYLQEYEKQSEKNLNDPKLSDMRDIIKREYDDFTSNMKYVEYAFLTCHKYNLDTKLAKSDKKVQKSKI